MSYDSEYQKLLTKYADLSSKAAMGDKIAREDKGKIHDEVRNVERAAARDGIILTRDISTNPRTGAKTLNGKGFTSTETDAKRDLQKQYVRKFKEQYGDDEPEVEIKTPGNPKSEKTTLSAWHKKRLGV